MYYKFAHPHQSLRIKNVNGTCTKRSSAMAAAIASRIWSVRVIPTLLNHE
jgi:hypothetical protein